MSAFDEQIRQYRDALRVYWPDVRPRFVADLHRVLDSLPFTAPEAIGVAACRAWEVYLECGDTDVGRAGVLLTYLLNDEWKSRRSS